MANATESLPNNDVQGDSPKIKDVGLAVVLSGPAKVGAPIVLRGAYRLDGATARQFQGQPLVSTMIIVVRRDKAMGNIRMVMDGHNVHLKPAPQGPVNPTLRVGGYFNVDLAAFSGIITEPGRYWVMAALGDMVSERLEFSVVQ